MKIAATYDISTDSIFQHFGKTQNFKVYTIEDGKIADSKVIDNGGFGHHDLATYLKNLGIETLILGNRGQGAIDALNNAGLKQIAGITGNPDDAVKAFSGRHTKRQSGCKVRPSPRRTPPRTFRKHAYRTTSFYAGKIKSI